jgi:hypothetical protein
MRRRIEIVAFERERIIQRSVLTNCPVCLSQTELLTPSQAAAMAQVAAQDIDQWITQLRTHGATTPDGQHRICKNSLLQFSNSQDKERLLKGKS